MQYLSKLSKRIACCHAVAVAALLLASCNLNLQEPIPFDALNPPDETIPLPETPRVCENEPQGFTRGVDAPMNVLPTLYPNYSAEGFTHWPNQAPSLAITESPTAPLSPNAVLRVMFPRGHPGGGAPSRWGSRALPANTGSVFACAWIRFMPGWSSNGNVSTKLFFIKGPQGTNHFVGADAGEERTHAYLYSSMQFVDGSLTHNYGQVREGFNDMAGGGWHKLEVLWEANTPGVRDGRYHQWLDGRLVTVATNAFYFVEGQQPVWDIIWWDPTFGGGLNPVPFDQFFEVDHFIASVK